MKICFYNVTAAIHYGGLETYCWEAGRALAQRGHKVTIVAGEGGKARHNEATLIEFPFTDRSRFPNWGTRFRKLMERVSFARHAASHLINSDYDAVIINKPFDFLALWYAKRRGMKAQTIFRSGGTDFFRGDTFFSNAIDHWVSTSRYNAQQIEQRYHHAINIIHNGVDTTAFAPGPRTPAIRASWGIPENAPLVVSVGRLIGWKGIHIIIEALSHIPSAHYAIIGDGAEKDRLQAIVTKHGMTDRIHFLGALAHELLPQTLREADIFVQPSIGEEAFGISVVEAMACGLPVLASRNGGMVEIVLDHETGRLLPPGDVPAWQEAITGLLSHPATRSHMGQQARQRAEAEFTWAANARKIEQLLLERKN